MLRKSRKLLLIVIDGVEPRQYSAAPPSLHGWQAPPVNFPSVG